ncbi:MAG TPA: NRDE family protein [Gammaproteobacteria bacterium]|nr:NRDE family protein [Gammaproteobacteria bacterium]
MCLLFVAWEAHPRYRVVVAANRDEFHQRPTAPAAFWEDHPEVAAGRDLQAGGTWLGVARTGRYAAVTNYREAASPPDAERSRGELVSGALLYPGPTGDYLRAVERRGREYQGFNLLAGDGDGLWYYSNRDGHPRRLTPGLYGLSNGLLDTPWPKLAGGRTDFSRLLAGTDRIEPESLFALLADETPAPDEALPDTGMSLERERRLSARFVRGPEYGTRSSTVILIDRAGGACLVERRFRPDGSREATTRLDFHLTSANGGEDSQGSL